MVTISQRDIAEKLSLSVATVSRCLRQDASIPAETRAKVLTLASRMGYRSKAKELTGHVRGPKTKERPAMVLAAFVQADDFRTEENTFGIIGGMSRAAHEAGASVVLHSVSYAHRGQIHMPENQPDLMRAGMVQGVILINTFEAASVTQLASRTACVGVDIQYPDLQIDYVGEENIRSMGRILDHLAGFGHRKIGFIDFPCQISTLEERLAGVFLGAMTRGIEFHRRHILRWHDRQKTSEDFSVLAEWLREGVTALVCANDVVAFEVCRWLRDNGYRCPEDVSVTGFDQRMLPADVPSVTTVAVHFEDLGRLAVERLVARLKQPTLPVVRLMVEGELRLGASTGPARVVST